MIRKIGKAILPQISQLNIKLDKIKLIQELNQN